MSLIISRTLLIGYAAEIVKPARVGPRRKELRIRPKSNLEEGVAKTVSMIGIDPDELVWVRSMLFLLRHPDPLVAEMTRQALLYLERNANDQARPRATLADYPG